MKNKTLILANILSTIYAGFLLYTYGLPIIQAGGFEYLEQVVWSFQVLFDIFGFDSTALNIISAFATLLGIHIVIFPIGCIAGWIGLMCKKSGLAKFGAFLYLVGTLCFPIYLIFGLPITIVGFIGSNKQKKLNCAPNIQTESIQ